MSSRDSKRDPSTPPESPLSGESDVSPPHDLNWAVMTSLYPEDFTESERAEASRILKSHSAVEVSQWSLSRVRSAQSLPYVRDESQLFLSENAKQTILEEASRVAARRRAQLATEKRAQGRLSRWGLGLISSLNVPPSLSWAMVFGLALVGVWSYQQTSEPGSSLSAPFISKDSDPLLVSESREDEKTQALLEEPTTSVQAPKNEKYLGDQVSERLVIEDSETGADKRRDSEGSQKESPERRLSRKALNVELTQPVTPPKKPRKARRARRQAQLKAKAKPRKRRGKSRAKVARSQTSRDDLGRGQKTKSSRRRGSALAREELSLEMSSTLAVDDAKPSPSSAPKPSASKRSPSPAYAPPPPPQEPTAIEASPEPEAMMVTSRRPQAYPEEEAEEVNIAQPKGRRKRLRSTQRESVSGSARSSASVATKSSGRATTPAPSQADRLPSKPTMENLLSLIRRQRSQCDTSELNETITVRVKVRVVSTGEITKASALAPHRGSPLALCLERLVKRQRLSPFSEPEVNFILPLKITSPRITEILPLEPTSPPTIESQSF